MTELHTKIVSSPKSGELILTLRDYYQWFKTLQSYEKAELRQKKLSPELRCEKIIALKRKLEENQLAAYRTTAGYSAALFQNLGNPDTQSTLHKFADKLHHLDSQQLNSTLDVPPEQQLDMLKE
ncbi:hypothetical protein FACS189427_05260 [Planctomycetales bacterium]|nr:hypothetical protein FACS189427_05260 [Planctomycetales bacterium]